MAYDFTNERERIDNEAEVPLQSPILSLETNLWVRNNFPNYIEGKDYKSDRRFLTSISNLKVYLGNNIKKILEAARVLIQSRGYPQELVVELLGINEEI